jgi:putative transposase
VQRQESVEYLKHEKNVSHARACRLVGLSRTQKYYVKKLPGRDKELREIIRGVIGSSRQGREKVIRKVQRKYPHLGASKIRRVYEREGFSLYKRLKRRVQHQVCNPIEIPLSRNQEWAMDFMSDALSNGRRFRTFNVVDHYNRQCTGICVSHNFPAIRVIAELEIMISLHGKPKRIRTDNGTEFRSKRFQLWLKENDIEWSPIQNGKPQQNAIVERFNKTYREDVLDAYLFDSISHAQQLTDDWVKEYNTDRPHQALNYLTPEEYAA